MRRGTAALLWWPDALTQISVFDPDPTPEQVHLLENRLYEFNAAASGVSDGAALAIFVYGDSGEIVGGLCGHTWGGCCEIRQLWLAEDLRGQGIGSALMHAA